MAYLKLDRNFFDGKFWNEKRVYSKAEAWIDLIREARFEVEPKTTFIKDKLITWGRGQLPASLRYLGDRWGWSKDKVARFIDFLVSDGCVKIETPKGTQQTILTLCNYDTYNPIKSESETPSETPTRHQRDKTNKGNNNISKDILSGIVDSVIEYLNEKCSKTFNTKSEKTKSLIAARVNDGFKVVDFFAVIDVKSSQWLNDFKMNKFLRPETLFSNKFESYLQESQAKVVPLNTTPVKKSHHILLASN